MNAAPTSGGLGRRLWAYQRERFPLVQHAPLIAAFSYSAVCFSRLLRLHDAENFALPEPLPAAVAFGCCLLFFLQLRIADEFKDAAEDAAFRPYRPVPRGLITLRELAWLGAIAALIQTALVLLLDWRLLILLGIAWIYFALMTREFFARAWLKRRPVIYLLSHMMIMPLVDLFATGCDWVPAQKSPPAFGLALFLLASYGNGVVLEIGRKLRAPADEEHGVETYSVLWGRRSAVTAWLAVITGTGALAFAASFVIDAVWIVGAAVAVFLAISLLSSLHFLRDPKPGSGKRIEKLAGIWIIMLYVSLGIVPAALREWM